MKRWIHASTDEESSILQALSDIFDDYELLVRYYPGTDRYIVYPKDWPWPYYYCRCIKFGDKKVDGNDILVSEDYLDGANTSLPQSAIDKAVKASGRAKAKMNEYRLGYPDEWPSGYMSGKFIDLLTKYLYNDIEEEDRRHGLKFEMSSMLPTANSKVYYDDILSKVHKATLTYKQWLKDMHNMALSAVTRSQFLEAYSKYLDELI